MDCYFRENAGEVLVGNSKLEIGISKRNGRVVSLKNKVTGTEYIQVKHFSTNFVIIYPLATESEIDTIDFDIRGEEQVVSSIEKGRKDDGSVVLNVSYDHMETRRGPMKLAVTYTVQVKPDSDETVWKISIDNQGKYIVREVWFPRISGIYKIGKDMVVLPFWAGKIIRDPINTLPPLEDERKMSRMDRGGFGVNLARLKLRAHYPGEASMQWLDYCNEDEGLYLASYDRSLAFTGIQFEKMINLDEKARLTSYDQALGMFFIKYPFIRPGEKWGSPEFILSLHQGDWHVGADKYREWAGSWMKSCDIPNWVREVNGYILPTLKQQSGRITRDYSDLPEMCKEAINKLGINLLYPWGWNRGGIDTDFPHYIAWDEDALRDAIRKIHEEGGRIILPIGTRIVNIRTKEYSEYGRKWAVKTMHNVELREHWEHGIGICPSYYQYGEDFVVICPSIKGWHEELKKYALKIITDYGADGVELDQVGGCFLCFDSDHPHENPALAYGPGYVEMFKTIREAVKQANDEAVLLEEGLVDAYTQYVDIHYQVPIENAEVFRYTFPEVVIFAKPTIDYHLLNYAFSLGLRFDFDWMYLDVLDILKRYPDFQNYVKELNQLRQSVKDYMIYGRFIDNVGLRSSDPNVEVKGYKNKHGIALVVWNKGLRESYPIIYIDTEKLGINKSSKYIVKDVKYEEHILSPTGSALWKGEELKSIAIGKIPSERCRVILIYVPES